MSNRIDINSYKIISSPEIIDLIKKAIKDSQKDKILLLVEISDYNDKPVSGHSNLFVIDKSNHTTYVFDPNYEPSVNMNYTIRDAYVSLSKDIGTFDFLGYAPQSCGIGEHGGMCSFIAIISFYNPIKLTFNKIKEELLKYFNWELENIKARLIVTPSFGTTFYADIKYLLQL